MSMLLLTDKTFHDKVRREGVTLVDFGAPWCPPCKVIKPILNELGEELGAKLNVLEVNCDESPEIATRYGIMSMPTVIIFHNGEPVEKLVGLRPKAVYENLLARYV